VAHTRRGNVRWNIVGWLAAGSVPASAVTLVLLHLFVPDPGKLSAIVSVALGFALILTAGTLVQGKASRLGGAVALRPGRFRQLARRNAPSRSARFSDLWSRFPR